MTIAALFVAKGGCYFGLPGVDPWDAERGAQLYDGPHPVVAHPPCERWGRYWGGSPTTWPRLVKGDDKGCFASALASVRRWGGVLEHPAHSAAWAHHRLVAPPLEGGWVAADWLDGHAGWTCHVEQGAYGHKARKATWLYAVGIDFPELAWGTGRGRLSAIRGQLSERRGTRSRHQDLPFRDVLLTIGSVSPSTKRRPHEQ